MLCYFQKGLNYTDMPFDQIPDLAQDRPRWQTFTNRLMLAHANDRSRQKRRKTTLRGPAGLITCCMPWCVKLPGGPLKPITTY